jgi:hypothetical protein
MKLNQLILDAKQAHVESKIVNGTMYLKVFGQLHDLSRMAFDTYDKVSFDGSFNNSL